MNLHKTKQNKNIWMDVRSETTDVREPHQIGQWTKGHKRHWTFNQNFCTSLGLS